MNLLKSDVMKYLTADEISAIFDNKKMLKNIDYIFSRTIEKEYGVLRESGTAKRVTFIVDKEGKISKIIEVSDIETHAAEVYEAANELN
jgi:peroxiredoxin